MPKQKTHRGAAKRFKISGGGKLVRRQSMKSHILTKKTRKRKRRLRQQVVTTGKTARDSRGYRAWPTKKVIIGWAASPIIEVSASGK